MAFTARPPLAILRDLIGMTIGRTTLDDIAEGSVLHTLLAAIAQEIANEERMIERVRNAYFLEGAVGTLLDERVAEFPPVGVTRTAATPSSGSVLKITRGDSAAALLIPAGSTVGDADGRVWRTTVDSTIPPGDLEISAVHIVCTDIGTATNLKTGLIITPIDMPDDVTSVTNTGPLVNGQDQESDENLRTRARLYLASLARCTPSALRYAALSFVGTDGSVFRYASVHEDHASPGLSRVYVDDGTGALGSGLIRDGAATGGVVPPGPLAILSHEYPATTPITSAHISLSRNGVEQVVGNVISLHERGIAYLEGAQEGDVWTVSGYRVYAGLVGELQREIEGDTDTPDKLTGFRAAGCRVIVTPIEKLNVEFDVIIAAESGHPVRSLQEKVRSVIHGYLASLHPGETMYVSRMVEQSLAIDGLADIRFLTKNTETPLANIAPEHTQAIRPTDLTVSFRGVA